MIKLKLNSFLLISFMNSSKNGWKEGFYNNIDHLLISEYILYSRQREIRLIMYVVDRNDIEVLLFHVFVSVYVLHLAFSTISRTFAVTSSTLIVSVMSMLKAFSSSSPAGSQSSAYLTKDSIIASPNSSLCLAETPFLTHSLVRFRTMKTEFKNGLCEKLGNHLTTNNCDTVR